MRIAREVRRFIERECLGGVTEDDPLASGLLDSLAMGQLISFLEKEYGVEFEDEELVAENFASLDAVADLVRSKLETARAT